MKMSTLHYQQNLLAEYWPRNWGSCVESHIWFACSLLWFRMLWYLCESV